MIGRSLSVPLPHQPEKEGTFKNRVENQNARKSQHAATLPPTVYQLNARKVKCGYKHHSSGRTFQMGCAQQEGILRIIQSIPSPKAEPFKRWLAMTGSRRLDEINSSEIEAERERLCLLGFSEREISHRIDGLLKNCELRLVW